MKQLRNAIMRSFVLYFLGLSIAGDLIDELIKEVDTWVFNNKFQVIAPIIASVFQVLAIVLFSFMFYRSLNKKIGKESQKLAKEQSTLFANIAHDLKTPLTSITGFSKALNEEVVEPEEVKEVSGIIYQKSVTANELLDLMFQYTKLHSAEFTLNRQECVINRLLKEVIADNYDLIEAAEIELELSIPDEPITRKIDQREFRRVFDNLLINACKHNPPHTRLRISLVCQSTSVKISFADNGTPIPKKDREQLFQPFISENELERNFQGSGLGLAIVKAIVDKHGFSIELLDDEDFTKKFEIRL